MLGWDALGPKRSNGHSHQEALISGLTQVTLTGACCLYRRDVFEQGLRWSDHPRGEDAGLAMQARELEIPLYVLPNARTRHVQRNGEVWR